MKQTVNFDEFTAAFVNINRGDNFSYAGLRVIFDWLESFESETGSEFEFDPIAICCDFVEYESLEDFQADYGEDYETIEDIQCVTTVLPIDEESFVIEQF